MSMSLRVFGYVAGEDLANEEAGTELGYGPYPIRVEDEHVGVAQYSAEMERGFDVDLDGLDPKIRKLRFVVSF